MAATASPSRADALSREPIVAVSGNEELATIAVPRGAPGDDQEPVRQRQVEAWQSAMPGAANRITTCAAATPMSTDQGALPKTRATPIAMALRAARRIKLPNTNGESRSSKAKTRYPLIEPITNPSAAPRPTAE